jgi:hypothetical protein
MQKYCENLSTFEDTLKYAHPWKVVQCDISKGIIIVCFHLGHQIIDPEDVINVAMAKWVICALEVGEIYHGVSVNIFLINKTIKMG